MYATSTASTTSSSGAARAQPERRVRVVRLLRPRRAAPAFGFNLRGGNEHATGFFVSKVEFNSEAHLQGLKVGDQLVSVNGYRVDDAVHSELIHYLASQSRLKIKVRNVGMLPIREKPHEPLSWQFISEGLSLGSEVSSSPTICDTTCLQDLRLSILVPPRAKLGCGICKGPEWKPGIFVQFVREGGIAREAGLRPGDQIMSCNGYDFTNIPFTEAVAVMKVIGRLELVVREGAGTELVSPESSGYNSSASSAAGERSPAPPAPAPPAPLAPPAALRRRLASVAEEAADRVDRLTSNRSKRRTWSSKDFEWKNNDMHNFDIPSDIEPDYDCPSIPNNPNNFESKNNTKNIPKPEFISAPSNRTIINLTEDGATIQCSYDDSKKSNSAHGQSNKDGKTIVVEVHHTNTTQCSSKAHCHPPPPKMQPSFDSSSISSSNTLSSAIAEEIQRRKMTKKNQNPDVTAPAVPPVVPKKPNAPKLDEKKKQHDALMDEFKKVHRKMFMNQETAEEKKELGDSADRQPTLPLRKTDHIANGIGHHIPNINGNHIPNGPNNTGTDGFHTAHNSNKHQKNSSNSVVNNRDHVTINGHQDAVDGNHAATNGNQATKNGNHAATNGNQATKNGNHAATNGNQATNNGNHAATNGNQATNNGNHAATNGNQATKNGNHAATNGNQVTNNGNHAATNGNQATKNGNHAATNGNQATNNGNHAATNGNQATNNGNHAATNGSFAPKNGIPPPPPPMPVTNGQIYEEHSKVEDRQKSIKEIGLELLNSAKSRNNSLNRTPTPDYNEKPAHVNVKEEKAELDSLESYKLKSPSNATPKPPSNYFVSPPNGTATMKKHLRPISVTIGEYAYGGGNRKEPSKLEFLAGEKSPRNGHNDEPITNRLQSELALTLSRSNLRKKTDVMGDAGR